MRAYLETRRQIDIHVDKWFYNGKTEGFTLYGCGSGGQPLRVERVEERTGDFIYHAWSECDLDIETDYTVYEKYGSHCRLLAGGYVRTEEFDRRYGYDGNDLGPDYREDRTVFKLWAPLARKVVLISYPDGAAHAMRRGERGVWTCGLERDCDRLEYAYVVDNMGQISETLDPYAMASTANGRRSVVINPKRLGFAVDKSRLPPVTGLHELVTYELSVRDYTSQEKLSTFEALAERLDYIEQLGVTNLQLLPVYDFHTVNEEDRFAHYNWGYDPYNYNVPDGSFVENPNDPYARLNGLGRLIAAANRRGIRVTMDVVYNHVYDAMGSIYNKTVPGYFTRYHADGTVSNGSFCGNDFRSEGRMVRKFIVDSVCMYARVYGVDGFRFDLMGDLDIETMNAVKAALGPGVMVYGEGWNMPSALPEGTRACIENQGLLPGIAHFNDRFRNAFKGHSHKPEGRGLLFGKEEEQENLDKLMLGSPHVFSDLSKSINYVECHDNHTFYDWVTIAHQVADEAETRAICTQGLAAVLLSFGAPFIHAGQEFLRTKGGVENSYNASDGINRFDWRRMEAHREIVEFTRELIRFRRSRPEYRYGTEELNRRVTCHLPGINIVEISSDQMRILFNFSGADYPLDTVDGRFASNLKIRPGVLKKHQVCYRALT